MASCWRAPHVVTGERGEKKAADTYFLTSFASSLFFLWSKDAYFKTDARKYFSFWDALNTWNKKQRFLGFDGQTNVHDTARIPFSLVLDH